MFIKKGELAVGTHNSVPFSSPEVKLTLEQAKTLLLAIQLALLNCEEIEAVGVPQRDEELSSTIEAAIANCVKAAEIALDALDRFRRAKNENFPETVSIGSQEVELLPALDRVKLRKERLTDYEDELPF